MTQFDFTSLPLHGSNVKSEKNVTWKNISYSVRRLLQCKLDKKKLTTWKRTKWLVIFTLPSLMTIKLGSKLKFICSNSTIETLEKHVEHVQG